MNEDRAWPTRNVASKVSFNFVCPQPTAHFPNLPAIGVTGYFGTAE